MIGPPGTGSPSDDLTTCGHEIAIGLQEPSPAVLDGHAGWRGALQRAADQSRQDPEILRVADELFMAAHDIRTPAAIRAYAESTLQTVTGAAARQLLQGILDALQG